MTTPTTADTEVLDLSSIAEELLGKAREQPAGRTARTLTPGGGSPLKQVLLAMTEGSVLQDHRAPGPATVQVLTGRLRLTWDGREQAVSEGRWAAIPATVHGVTADTDTVALLTVGVAANTRLPAEEGT